MTQLRYKAILNNQTLTIKSMLTLTNLKLNNFS